MRRLRGISGQSVALVVLALLLALAVGLLVVAYVTPSKARPISHARPAPTTVVEQGKIAATLVASGSLKAADTQKVAIPTSTDTSVVTHVATQPGSGVPYCGVVMEVSGRPVFALSGQFPAYRDIHVGDSGTDVRQLQQALRACGYGIAVDGKAGPATARAVAAMYKRAGYTLTPSNTPAPSPAPSEDPAAGGASSPGSPATVAAPVLVIPRGEVVFVNAGASIVSLPGVGASISADTNLEVASGQRHVVLALTTQQLLRVKAGMPVHMSAGGWQADVTLPELPTTPDPQPEGQGSTEPTYTVVLPAEGAPGGEVSGVQCEIALGDQTTYPKVVPAQAVHYEGDSTVVYVPDDRAEQGRRRVVVKVVATGDALVAIEGKIETGQKVFTDAPTH